MFNRFFFGFLIFLPATVVAEEVRITNHEVISFQNKTSSVFVRTADDRFLSTNEFKFHHLDLAGKVDFRFSLSLYEWERQSQKFDDLLTQIFARDCNKHPADCLRTPLAFLDLPGTEEGRFTKFTIRQLPETAIDDPAGFQHVSMGQFRSGRYRITFGSQSKLDDIQLFEDFLRFLSEVQVIDGRPMPPNPDALTQENCPVKIQQFREKYCALNKVDVKEKCRNESTSMIEDCKFVHMVKVVSAKNELNEAIATCHFSAEPCD